MAEAEPSAANAPLAFGLLPVVSEKLTRGNYNMWHAQVSSALKGARLAGYIKSTAAPPPKFLEGDSSSPANGKKLTDGKEPEP